MQRAVQFAALAALGMLATGCASMTEQLVDLKQSVTTSLGVGSTAPAPVVVPVSALAPVSAKAQRLEQAQAVSAVAMRVDDEPPVNAAVARAYADALRALRAGRSEEAERGLRALVKSNPELGGPHANLGLIHRQADRLDEAVAELELAAVASPRQPAYWNQLGITYRMHGRFDKARDAYDKAIGLDAQYAAALLNLGILHDLYLWDGKRALELYERYLSLTPGGDAAVTKWVADLKNRRPAQAAAAAPPRKETP